MHVFSTLALACLLNLHKLSAAMAPLPRDFAACEKDTLQGEAEEETALPDLKARDTMVIGKSLLWSAWPMDSNATTETVFDELWKWLGKDCKRSQSQILSLGTSEFVICVVDFFWSLCEIEHDVGCCDFVQQNAWSQRTCRSRSRIPICDVLVGN